MLNKKRNNKKIDNWGISWSLKYFVYEHFGSEPISGKTKIFKILRFYELAKLTGTITDEKTE